MKYVLLVSCLVLLSCSNKVDDEGTETFLNVKGNRIHVKMEGEGKPIVLAHGGYLDLRMWDPQISSLTPTHKVIRFSDLGHGKSIASASEVFGHEILDRLSQKNPEQKMTLLGLSWGAMLCVDYTLRYPEKVDLLILVSPGLSGWEYFQDTLALRNYELRQEAIAASDTNLTATLFHKNWVVGPRRDDATLDQDFLNKSYEMIRHNLSKHWKEDWSSLDSIQAIHRLEEITVPTYIVIGEDDAEDILLIAEEYLSRIPSAEKVVVEKSAHLINMEHPEKFNQIIADILKQ